MRWAFPLLSVGQKAAGETGGLTLAEAGRVWSRFSEASEGFQAVVSVFCPFIALLNFTVTIG